MVDIKQLCMNAKQASYELSGMPENKKNEILTAKIGRASCRERV